MSILPSSLLFLPQTAPLPVILSDDNFSDWCQVTAATLKVRGLWRHVLGTSLVPSDPEKLELWEDAKFLTAGLLILSVETALRQQLLAGLEDDPRTVWQSLVDHFTSCSHSLPLSEPSPVVELIISGPRPHDSVVIEAEQ